MSTSNLNGLVLDPFIESATAAAVANNMLREIVLIKGIVAYKIGNKKPKITFRNLINIKKGYTKIGDIFRKKR